MPKVAETLLRIAFPQILNLDAFARVMHDLESITERRTGIVVLDFSRTERAYPDGVVPLIATLMRLRAETGIHTEIELPQQDALRGVFHGVGWSRYLAADRPDFDPLPISTRKFTPVRPFRD